MWRIEKFAQAAQILNYSNTKNAPGSIGWASYALPLQKPFLNIDTKAAAARFILPGRRQKITMRFSVVCHIN
jgi:hypothetical protein